MLTGTEVKYSKDGTVAEIVIPTVGNGNDEQSTAALNEIRDDIVPATIGGIEGVTVASQRRRRGVEGLPRPAQRAGCR